ncbi:aurora kinase A and ninein-interacting protein-like [Cuculus canorus]|uniref:aurora kinase A and ninein-interacting protein-like n=1 Tax=Cuculus canorus TaxID=55661 RepID=UPI0023AB53CD|nr:aurora kinase A and ninein-interacting protein-like [Cuculus canorus]
MKRSRAAPGACDVWLDTAQSVIAKPKVSSRILGWKHATVAFTQSGASQPCTKQTTISSFFSKQTDEKDKENSRPSPCIPNKACKDKSISLAASRVKILALPQMEETRTRSFRAERERSPATPSCSAQASPAPLPDSPWLQAESHRKSEASCEVGEDSCCFSFTQESERNCVITHRNESHLFAGEMASSGCVTLNCGINTKVGQVCPAEEKTRFDFQPRLGANQTKKPQQSSGVNSLIDFTETENLRTDSTWAAGFCSSPSSRAGVQPLRERSWNAGAGPAEEGGGWKPGRSSPCRQLFTQDSEGNRVIAHCCQSVPSPCKDSSGWQLPCSSHRGCATRSASSLGEQQSETCYDHLFTQDSEGNRVMKHCDLEWLTE